LAVPPQSLTEAQLQTELLHAQKMETLGQLISGLAHEINNPLAAIIAFSQLMLADERLPADLKRDAQLLIGEAERTRRIAQNLLEFARQRAPVRQPTHIAPLLDRTLELNAYALRAGRIEVRRQVPDDLPAVMADPDQIQQVLLNLTLNAVHALESRAGGTITVAAWIEDERVRLKMEDDGPGVDESARERLFEPFFTTKVDGAGTGLGLAVSREIAVAHGGMLWFEPAASGGAAFLLDLPVV
jgi:two-component system NtrC family sensor kinase